MCICLINSVVCLFSVFFPTCCKKKKEKQASKHTTLSVFHFAWVYGKCNCISKTTKDYFSGEIGGHLVFFFLRLWILTMKMDIWFCEDVCFSRLSRVCSQSRAVTADAGVSEAGRGWGWEALFCSLDTGVCVVQVSVLPVHLTFAVRGFQTQHPRQLGWMILCSEGPSFASWMFSSTPGPSSLDASTPLPSQPRQLKNVTLYLVEWRLWGL